MPLGKIMKTPTSSEPVATNNSIDSSTIESSNTNGTSTHVISENTGNTPVIRLMLKPTNVTNDGASSNSSPSRSSMPPNSRISTFNSYKVETREFNNDPNTFFEYTFSDHQADAFKSLVDYMQRITTSCYIYCSQGQITLIMGNNDKSILNVATIETSNLFKSEYTSDEEVFIFMPNLKLLKKALKNVGKTSSLVMYRTDEDNCIYFEIISSKGTVGNDSTVEVVLPEEIQTIVDYPIPEYNREPNLKLITCESFKTAGDGNYDKVTIRCYQSGLRILGGLATNNSNNSGSFHTCGVIERGSSPIDTKVVKRSHIKHFNSIDKLSVGSLTKLWFSEEGNAMQIQKKIGHIGTLNIYVTGLPA